MYALILAMLLPFSSTVSDLTVKVSGCKTQKGQLYIALYDNKDLFPVFGKQLRGEIVPLSKGKQFTFKKHYNFQI